MKTPLTRVAVLEDDPDCRKLLKYGLGDGHDVRFAQNGAELQVLIDSGEVDVVLLDVQLPREDGFSIARRIRRSSRVPIIFVSGLDEDDAVVKGLNIGGDDYVTKPFSLTVLAARIRNLSRREPEPRTPAVAPLYLGELGLDLAGKLVAHADGRTAQLTDMEAQVLAMLIQAEGAPVSRDDLFRRIHGREWDRMSREIDVHVSNLRRKLDASFGIKDTVHHVRGIGYRIYPPVFNA